MLTTDLYINSAGIISSAGNNIAGGDFLLSPPGYHTHALMAIEPDYKTHIPVMQLRRMSKAVRMGVVAAKYAMQQTDIEKPGAISVGTAYGCLQDTDTFLGKMAEQQEQMLTPTAFIQSTHNTVSGQIALLAGCTAHNLTFVHRGHSFEHALINAALYIQQHKGAKVLAGGIDELTPNSIKALQQGGVVAKQPYTTDDVLRGGMNGAVAGEGAAFFVVSETPASSHYVRIKQLELFRADNNTALEKFNRLLKDKAPDILLAGNNGDKKYAELYEQLKVLLPGDIPLIYFKQLCGEYPVSGSFALGMIFDGIPPFTYTGTQPGSVKNVIIVNNYCDYFSFWELECNK